MFAIFILLFTLFVTCEFCQQISNAFSEIDDTIGQFNWYRFPNEINQMLPTILMMTQQPIEMKCFGSISCSQETFKKVQLIIQNHSVDFSSFN